MHLPNRPLRVLVCGSRDWKDVAAIQDALGVIFYRQGIRIVIHGGCDGADKIAGELAKHNETSTKSYPANWKTHGKAAGPIRNTKMLAEGKPDIVLAFTHDLEASRGTKDMVSKARAAGVSVFVLPEEMERLINEL